MYQDQIIDLIWDNSSPIDSTTMGMLTKAGQGPRASYWTFESRGFQEFRALCGVHSRERPIDHRVN